MLQFTTLLSAIMYIMLYILCLTQLKFICFVYQYLCDVENSYLYCEFIFGIIIYSGINYD